MFREPRPNAADIHSTYSGVPDPDLSLAPNSREEEKKDGPMMEEVSTYLNINLSPTCPGMHQGWGALGCGGGGWAGLGEGLG